MIGIVSEKTPDIQSALVSIRFSFENDDGRCGMSEPSFARLKPGKENANII
jgi:hypothetical protein